jgi:ribosomal protein S18 acetylase RimI-like enzyme
MARRGSLLQYANGTPDAFYDIGAPEFRRLFAWLREEECEIGLHASYNAWRSAQQIRHEKQALEEVAGIAVEGNRHHYWHLNPRAPHETLRLHEQAGMCYDSSLGFEFYPGFRRGICHPFRVFDPGERRELNLVELPPTWMDDHFDRRLAQNQIADPTGCARGLLDTARNLGGMVVIDYHARGMNGDFYPRYGPWLRNFAQKHLDSTLRFRTPRDIVREYVEFERALELNSVDRTAAPPAQSPGTETAFEVGPMHPDDIPAAARLHADMFGDPAVHGHSIATLGRDFLERGFYAPNLDNPYLCCTVARYRKEVVGFSVYSTDHEKAFQHLLRRHPVSVAVAGLRAIAARPRLLGVILSNMRYIGGEKLPFLARVHGWWIVAAVDPSFRTPEFERKTGIHVASRLFDHMEETMRDRKCPNWYGVVRPQNAAIKKFLERRGATLVGNSRAQGLQMDFYVKTFPAGGGAIDTATVQQVHA